MIFLQRWNDDAKAGPLCPNLDDYPIFFATMREPSKDNSGDKIFVKRQDLQAWEDAAKAPPANLASEAVDRYNVSPTVLNEFVLDEHEHLIVKHDLFSHEGLTEEGIAEAFQEFAKKEGLPFFP